jgi:hypothetical protein
MGSKDDEGEASEHPRHDVTIACFRQTPLLATAVFNRKPTFSAGDERAVTSQTRSDGPSRPASTASILSSAAKPISLRASITEVPICGSRNALSSS